MKEVKQDAARGRRKEEREMFREKMYEKRFADERAKGDSGLGPSAAEKFPMSCFYN